MSKTLHIFIFAFISANCFAQNLEQIGTKDMLKVNGGFNFNSTFYHADGIAARRDPLAWFFSGNINFSILDWSIPFSYSYSNLHGTFTQPFNQYGVAPQYKWIKTYIGYNSMNFSSYTLGGHVFLGAGAELTPKNWKINLMYGRLKKAVAFDAVNNSDANMAYKRMGYGARVGYEKNGHAVGLIYFHASDDPHSIPYVPASTPIRPMENTVVSVNGKSKITKHFFAEAEYALSGLTRNNLADADTSASLSVTKGGTNYLPGIFQMKTTSQFFSAVKGSLGYQLERIGVNLNYERIDPDYQTLGAYYFTNDMENITLAPSFHLLKNKLNIAINTGVQHNNLDKTKLGTMRRWVGAVNVNYVPTTKLNLSASYSNFTCYTRMRPKDDPYFQNSLDTLNFYQLSQNANGTVSYNFGKKKMKQSLMLTASYQVTGEHRGEQMDVISLYGATSHTTVPSVVYNGNAGYSANWIPSKTSGMIGFNMNESVLGNLTTVFLGPSIGVSQAFAKNTLRASIGSSYNRVLTNGNASSAVLNNRLSLNYTPKMKKEKYGKPSMGLNCSYLSRFATVSTSTSYSELTLMLNLNYGF